MLISYFNSWPGVIKMIFWVNDCDIRRYLSKISRFRFAERVYWNRSSRESKLFSINKFLFCTRTISHIAKVGVELQFKSHTQLMALSFA